MLKLIILATIPVFIFLFYIYIKDKFEREPLWLALTGFFWGVVATAPIVFCEMLMENFTPADLNFEPFYTSFMVAALVEEAFKFAVLYFLISRNKEFNEAFDAVVYGVFISLGFAAAENIFYVLSPDLGGVETGILRGVFAVPAHGLFGICMGYYFSFSKFSSVKKLNVLHAFFAAFIQHGLYDFFLLASFEFSSFVFLVFIVYLWIGGYVKINKLIQSSPFNKHIF